MSYRDRIVVDPAIRSGKPCVKGTRITVYDILEYLAGGMSEDDVLRDFQGLARDDVRAVLEFAAAPGLFHCAPAEHGLERCHPAPDLAR